MLPLNPPEGYWDKRHSLISEFIWNRKPPRIKLEMLQREKSAGGWGLPKRPQPPALLLKSIIGHLYYGQ